MKKISALVLIVILYFIASPLAFSKSEARDDVASSVSTYGTSSGALVPIKTDDEGVILSRFKDDSSHAATAEIILSATPGTITTVMIPDHAIGFRIYPRSNHVRFAVNASAAAVATVAANDQTVAVGDLAVGGFAKADTEMNRILPSGTGRYVTLRSITASVVVDFEVF